MYLHRIDLHGFKSFADKTQVQFDPGVTAIVGPNGCGKSNIIDAVRWVLGEQRARLLRSDKMESVIFNGTGTRRALGMAEVALTIHNTRGVLPTHYSEVTIGRRLFRSGESEYLLNGTTCRLKDILDLFMDTGMGAGAYSVIELKMIEDLLSESPQDRRRLFEEAAGITKYKLRRAQALRRLDQTQADLERLRDLTEEIQRSVNSLSRQAKKAERHRDLSDRLRHLELQLAATDRARLAADAERLTAEAQAHADQLIERSAQLEAREADAERQRTALVGHEQALAEAQRTLNRHTGQLRQAEADARLAAERRQSAEATLERFAREAGADEERRTVLDADAEALAAQIQQAEAALAEAEAEADRRAEARNAARAEADAAHAQGAEADRQTRDAAQTLRDAERELETRRSRHAVLVQELESVRQRLDATAEAQATRDAARQQAETEREARQATLAEAEAALTEAEAVRADLDNRIEALRSPLRDAQRRHDAARAEADVLRSLLDSYEGLSDAAQALLSSPDWAAAPQSLPDLLVCPPELRRALDAALGPLADCLVVQTEAEAQAGIARLRAEDTGRATFLVLDRLPERTSQVLSPTPPGTEPIAAQVSAAAPEHQSLVRLLLANTFLVDALDTAAGLQAQYPVARFIKPDGEWLGGGMVRAGGQEHTAAAERIGRREQWEAAEAAQKEDATEIERLEAAIAEAEADRRAVVPDAARTVVREAERALAGAERTVHQAITQAEAEARRREDLAARFAALTAQAEATQSTDAQEAARAEAAELLAEAEARRTEARDAADAAEARAREALAHHSEAAVAVARDRAGADTLRRDRDRALQALADIDDRSAARELERQRVEASRTEADTREAEHRQTAEGLIEDLGALRETVQTAETTLLEARATLSDTEALLRELRRLREASREAQSEARLQLADTEARLRALSERIETEHGLTPDALPTPDEDFDADDARARLPELRQQLRGLGAVNELALESYQEEKERLDFLLGQQNDLEEAEASLRTTIHEINATARQRFNETFEAVREAFQRLFVDLFGENASADIALTGDDPLEDDVEISARPKGKKPSAITQLSGGEKTLTAIALLFAIYLVKPSPFCILDEVDAPLDDANVERFMRLIHSFSDSTQFILVTHNKLTMESADRMYGVTMQEEGVSKLVGVRFDAALPEAA